MNYTKIYNKLYKHGYHNKLHKTHGLKLIKYMTKHLKFDSVLDVGCSHGKAVAILRGKGKRAIGIDVSDRAVRLARKARKGCKFEVGSVLDIPFEDESFDAIISTDVLEHLQLKDVDQAIQEITRIAKKYVGLKISSNPGQGRDNPRTSKKHAYFKASLEIPNLHLTIKPTEWWIDKFVHHKVIWRDMGSFVLEKK